MTAIVIRSDAAHLPLPDASVDLIVTSPPYFALRSYQDGGEHYAGQIGSETSPQEFLEALWACTREWMRVLKPSGSLFVNLGDKYSGAQQQSSGRQSDTSSSDYWKRTDPKRTGIPNKSLMGLPWRYAIGCIDQLGLILRAEIVWSKPNGLPESVTDRVRRSHEQWFHFTLQPRYFSAVDEIREPHDTAERKGLRTSYKPGQTSGNTLAGHTGKSDAGLPLNPLGKLPGSVWEIPSEPLTVPAHLGVDHFAAFPTAWPKRLILGWSPSGICTRCNGPRTPEVLRERAVTVGGATGAMWGKSGKHSNATGRRHAEASAHTILGYACACPDTSAPSRPAVVLDPFGGTGTTAAVASALGRIGISVDLSHDYSRLAQWRTTDPATRAKILGLPKPARQLDGQISLYDEVSA